MKNFLLLTLILFNSMYAWDFAEALLRLYGERQYLIKNQYTPRVQAALNQSKKNLVQLNAIEREIDKISQKMTEQ